jgi:tetratricopeptide (TPR) repeat protein
LTWRYYYDGQYADGGARAFAKAEEAAQRATSLDPNLVGPASYLRTRRADEGDLEGAFEAAQALVEHRPDSADALFTRSYVFRYAGMLEESHRDCEAALKLDPIARGLRSCANAFFLSGEFESVREFLSLDPGSEYSILVEAPILMLEGRESEALASLDGLAARNRYTELFNLFESCHEDTPEASASATASEAVARTFDSESVYFAAANLAYCGHDEEAFRVLRQAIDQGYCSYPGVDNDPRWDSLRQDPEFREIREAGIACHDRFVDYLEQRG